MAAAAVAAGGEAGRSVCRAGRAVRCLRRRQRWALMRHTPAVAVGVREVCGAHAGGRRDVGLFGARRVCRWAKSADGVLSADRAAPKPGDDDRASVRAGAARRPRALVRCEARGGVVVMCNCAAASSRLIGSQSVARSRVDGWVCVCIIGASWHLGALSGLCDAIEMRALCGVGARAAGDDRRRTRSPVVWRGEDRGSHSGILAPRITT